MTVVNHWIELPRWPAGRALYACYLTFAEQAELHQLVDAYQSALADLTNVDMILPEWRHMTVQGVAFIDELAPEEVERIETAVRDRLSRVPVLTARTGPVVLAQDSVYLPVGPVAPLASLREEVRAAVLSVIDPSRLYALPGQESDEFEPHVSVGYVNADGPADPLRKRLLTVDPTSAELSITYASLICLRKDDHKWAWTDEVRIPLAG